MTAVDCFAMSEPGHFREANDDFVVVEPAEGFIAVADGMGGRPGGDRASRIAATTLLHELRPLAAEARLDAVQLRRAMAAANAAVRAAAEADKTLTGMGTTLSAVVLRTAGDSEAAPGRIIHVGDSRVYRFTGGRLQRLTLDHTLAAELVARNHLTAKGAERYPLRHVLSRCLGTQEDVEPDIVDLELLPGDWLLLATDGLSKVMTEERLAVIIEAAEGTGAKALCHMIMQVATQEPPPDNVTVAVVRMLPAEEQAREDRKA